MMDDLTIAAATPITAGLVQVAKAAGVPDQLAGITSIIIAIPVVLLLVADPTSREAAITALATGLAASGLYSQTKTLLELRPGGRTDAPVN